jgi:hypothetical protein
VEVKFIEVNLMVEARASGIILEGDWNSIPGSLGIFLDPAQLSKLVEGGIKFLWR